MSAATAAPRGSLLFQPKILIVDDDLASIELVEEALSDRNLSIQKATTLERARSLCKCWEPDLVLLDMMMPDGSGLRLLEEIQRVDPRTEVMLTTAHYSTESAVEAIQKGASDYLNKPLDIPAFLQRIDRWIEDQKRRYEVSMLETELSKVSAMEGIIGRNPHMIELFSKLRRIAPHFSTVLVWGETGTGKEMVARALHSLSNRSGPMVVCNCAAVSESLFESELFGHERGSFTGAFQTRKGLVESAEGGTLFLDEVAEIPLGAQAKLLRLLQNREIQRVGSSRTIHIDVRVIAATHRDLKEAIAQRSFRDDLYYRLSAVQVSLPSLAARKEDLPLLEQHFLNLYGRRYQKPNLTLSRRAQAALAAHSWPGNIRELENVLSYACMITQNSAIDVTDFPDSFERRIPSGEQDLLSVDDLVYQHARRAVERCGGNRARAAEMIGISRATLYRLLSKASVALKESFQQNQL